LKLTTFTVAAWFKATQNFPLAQYGTHFIVNKGGLRNETIGYNLNYGIWMTNKGKIQGGFESISNENYFVTTKGEYNDDMWHYLIIAYDGVSLNLYIDGEKVASRLTNAKPDNAGNQLVA
jgi:Concanavalin A-like lectin/glucanases superfamily